MATGRHGGRRASVPLQEIWNLKSDEYERMLVESPDELRKKLLRELRERDFTIGIAKKVTDFMRYRLKVRGKKKQ
jgi:hypothetical protein